MTDWLLRKSFVTQSGAPSDFKIACDALTDEELETFAVLISKRFRYGRVHGIPRGAWPIANALQRYCTRFAGGRLIVDDLLSTGRSMEGERKDHTDIGVVLFARGPCPEWIHPVFQLWDMGR